VAVPGRETVLSNPNPDPGEVFDDVYAAMLERRGVPLPHHWTEIATTQQATDELDARHGSAASGSIAAPPGPGDAGDAESR
jgi:hypothetical protein